MASRAVISLVLALGCAPRGSGEEKSVPEAGATPSSLPEGSLGIVVVDVQETFVSSASNPDLSSILARTASAFELASAHALPFFVSFEASRSGEHALHAPLVPLLPAQAQSFTKTTFAATRLPEFAEAVTQAGVTHLVVLGAETDVCVMQTVLGLRALGFGVLLEHDAVFSSETNPSPALRRMQAAGALSIDLPRLAEYAVAPGTLPAAPEAQAVVVEPLAIGVVLNELTAASLAESDDPLTAEKSARLRELLLVSEWFELPVYVRDPGAGLPAAFASYFQGTLRPISALAADASIEQLVFAGTDFDLEAAILPWASGRVLFVMEDALLSRSGEPLAPLYEAGALPTTYKSFYYEMTRSVDLAEWPSPAWVERWNEYYWITQAPEDLPPIFGP